MPCWDSQLTKRYSLGDIADYPKDHVFLTGKIKCFEPVRPEDLVTSQVEAQVQIKKAFEMISDLSKKVETDKAPKEPDPIPEDKEPIRSPSGRFTKKVK